LRWDLSTINSLETQKKKNVAPITKKKKKKIKCEIILQVAKKYQML